MSANILRAGLIALVIPWSFFCWNRGFGAGADVSLCLVAHFQKRNDAENFDSCRHVKAISGTLEFLLQERLPDEIK